VARRRFIDDTAKIDEPEAQQIVDLFSQALRRNAD